MAAGIDGGIAPVLGPGVDAQQGHGTLGGFCTVGLHGRSMVGLFKIIGAAGAGGKADDVADLILKGAYIGDDTFVLGGGRGAGASASAAVLPDTHRASVRQRERARNSFFMG